MAINDRKPWFLVACDAVHPIAPSPKAEPITWGPRPEGMDRSRVSAWTCSECCNLWYELVQAGGVFYLRRLDADGAESWTRGQIYAVAILLWEDLLCGRAE